MGKSEKGKPQRRYMVGNAIHSALSKALVEGKILPAITERFLVNIVGVEVESTLRQVDVFITIMHDDVELKNSIISLFNNSSKIVNIIISENVRLRYVPRVRFLLSDVVDNISALDDFFDQIS